MKILKILIFTLFLTTYSFNVAYADEINYEGDWIRASYTNIKITKDISHWEFDRNFFATHDLSGDNLVSYGMGEWKKKPSVHRIRVIDSPAGYFSWEPGVGYIDFNDKVEWSKTTEIHRDGIDFIVDIPYYRRYSYEEFLGGGFGIFVHNFISKYVNYRDFKATFDTPSSTKTYYISEMANWVEKYIEEEATHGTFTIEKFPPYVFTKWHKLSDGTPCGMDLTISWDATRRFQNIKAQMIVVRYQDMGEDIFDIYDGPADSSGRIETRLEFEHAGNEESKLLIEFVTEEGNWGTIEAPIPVNGFFGINISEPVIVEGIFKKSPKDEGEFNF